METELLKCSACRTVVADSGECNCHFATNVHIGAALALYRHNLIQVIKGCISAGVPNQSEMARTDLPFHVRVGGGIINEVCLYPNCIQIFVDNFCDRYPIETPDSNSIESERAEGGSSRQESYTLPVRLMYVSEDVVMNPALYPDAIIQIPGRGLNWQQILEDVQSNRADLQWREINLYGYILGLENFQLSDFVDWWLHVRGTGGLNTSEELERQRIIYIDVEGDENGGDTTIHIQNHDFRGRIPAARSAVENLERERIEESRDFLCCICQSTMLAGESSVKMPCSHEYHENCILQWLEVSNSCPACNFELPTDDPE